MFPQDQYEQAIGKNRQILHQAVSRGRGKSRFERCIQHHRQGDSSDRGYSERSKGVLRTTQVTYKAPWWTSCYGHWDRSPKCNGREWSPIAICLLWLKAWSEVHVWPSNTYCHCSWNNIWFPWRVRRAMVGLQVSNKTYWPNDLFRQSVQTAIDEYIDL